jgi:hypothetical protein
MGKATHEKDYNLALFIVDSLMLSNPNISGFSVSKFGILAEQNEKSGYAYVRKLLCDGYNVESDLLKIGGLFQYYIKNKVFVAPDWELAIELYQLTFKLHLNQFKELLYVDLYSEAQVYELKHDFKMAASVQKKAISFFDRYNLNEPQIRKELLNKLDEYQNEVNH